MTNFNLKTLIEHLHGVFNTKIDRHTPEREVLLRIGQSEVIEYLESILEDNDVRIQQS